MTLDWVPGKIYIVSRKERHVKRKASVLFELKIECRIFCACVYIYIYKTKIEKEKYIYSYFPFQPVVHNWFIKGRGMYCSVYGKVHIKDPLLLIEKSSLCGGSGFPSKKCVNVTI